jgi:mono/diheme cytochrome c family protein
MKNLKTLFIVAAAAAIGMAACNSGEHRKNPGKAYAMDMTHSRAYDAYTSNPNFTDSQTSRMPVAGTVARGHSLPDHMVEGDTNGYKTFTTNARFSEAEVKEGGRLYNIYCGICHGTALDGNGPLYSSGKFAAMPANLVGGVLLKAPVGQIYAAIKFGKNAMGSYAGQLDPVQRWQIIAYIKKQQAGAGGDPFTLGTGPTAAPVGTDTAKKADEVAVNHTAQAGSAGANAAGQH